MIRIRIQYDKYNRTFKLLDKEFGRMLEDGDVYELPVSLCVRPGSIAILDSRIRTRCGNGAAFSRSSLGLAASGKCRA